MQSAGPQAPAEVVVVGGGNAALCAALAAREAGARVLLLERDHQLTRGGNSKYTRNVRCADPARYPPEELLDDLIRVTGEAIDLEMARFATEQSLSAPSWMERQGVVWQPALRGTQALSRTNRFFLGGGKALLNTYYRQAATVGVEVRYRSRVTALGTGPGHRVRLGVEGESGPSTVDARAVVVASGGFESNLEWLRRYRGDA
ncbi:MAG: FAD-dependent oxidoreductase, partial [Candidatus Dormibacteraeota bacterium]|nr:FAD-dependent oxidoreductase [Candidatus Dormibacteraeota bacterium]